MTSIKKSSAFLAFQLHGFDAEDASDEDRTQQKQKKQQKKKARGKKNNSENATLKGLAMCASTKKSKSKNAKAKQPKDEPLEHDEVAPQPEKPSDQSERQAKPKPSLQETQIPSDDWASKVSNSAVSVKRSDEAKPEKLSKNKKKQPSKPETKAIDDVAQKKPVNDAKQTSVQETPSNPPTTNASSLEAIYSPTHITITRADGQQTRTVAVSEIMDQLLLYREQNGHLLLAQQQLNQIANEQRTNDANLIASLHNEVNIFRQMCLNLQAENEHLKKQLVALSSPTARAPSPSVAASVAASQRTILARPPPGM